mgnify:CR=1 FL=1
MSAQGFDPHSFDIVLASDAIHATSRLRDTLANVMTLVAPSGLLLFIEQMKPTRWFDLVFGLLGGWWLFSDFDIRPDYPLMPMSGWKKLLGEAGLTDIAFAHLFDPETGEYQLVFLVHLRLRPQNGPSCSLSMRANSVRSGMKRMTIFWLLAPSRCLLKSRMARFLVS